MKKIYITLIILLMAMMGMAYLYFSRLNRETSYQEMSLHAATANSGLVFSIENDKSIFEILKGQDLFEKLIGPAKFDQLRLLKEKLVNNNAVNSLAAHRNIFISFSAGKNKEIDYLISTQLNNAQDRPQLLELLKANGLKIDTAKGGTSLRLNDSTSFYVAVEKNLILLSNSPEPVQIALQHKTDSQAKEFAAYINSSSKLRKNSVGNLYINFNRLPALAKAIIPGKLNGNLSALANQHSFAALNYNFSKERLFFNGSSQLNNPKDYLNLFAQLQPQKNTIDNLLPDHTANFRLYAIPGYKSWLVRLKQWFIQHREDQAVKKVIANTKTSYRLNPDEIFPAYFRDQLICFQLSTAENLAAINLSNGDKVKQLMLDISEEYDQDIKKLKVNGLLYAYFGEPLKQFGTPYYTIIDNYMVISNYPATLQHFLNKYRRSELLINNAEYMSQYTQISNSAGVTYYVNYHNSAGLIKKNLYTPYHKHLMAKEGMGAFSSFIYQLSGDQGNFQTNLLINTLPVTATDTLSNLTTSISEQ